MEIRAFVADGTPLEADRAARPTRSRSIPRCCDVDVVTQEQALDARAEGARRVPATCSSREFLPASLDVRLKPGFRDPATVRSVADARARVLVRRRHALRRGVDHAALSPAQHRRRRRHRARSRVRGGGGDHHRRDDSHGGAGARAGDLDHAARGRDGRRSSAARSSSKGSSRASSADCSRSLLTYARARAASTSTCIETVFFDQRLAALGLLFGALIGLLGSAVSVGRHLRRV